ncbi:MAG: DUF378 domain-containing protein [Candidatus Paceibacterota bacterium]|jgi:hypothetical protein
MNSLKVLDWVSLILVIIGGLNWGLVGIFQFDLVAYLLGTIPLLQNAVYVLVALAAIYLLVVSVKLGRK